MSFLSSLQGTVLQGYAALQGPQGQPQSPTETLTKLLDRLQNSSQHEDRRSSILGIKGMARDWKLEVGQVAFPAILDLLGEPGLEEDLDMARAVLETLNILCEVEEGEPGRPSKTDCGVAHVDTFLMTSEPTHAVLSLLSTSSFYIRFFSLQLLGALLTAPAPRPLTLQAHFLTAPGGLGTILSILDDTREILRNEVLLILLNITEKNADIQKIIAFEGGFDRLFHIIDVEGGIGAGGIVVQDCLLCVGQLLRYNVSNQNYFRETSCIPHLAPMLLFPPAQDPHPVALDSFATQPWSEQKLNNALLVLALARTLVSGAGAGKIANQRALLIGGLTRCLAEMGLASAAPPVLKCEALHILAHVVRGSEINQDFISKLVMNPLAASSPSSGQESGYSDREKPEFYRLPPQSTILALFSLILEGLPGTPNPPSTEDGLHSLPVRAAALSVLDSFLNGNIDAQLGIVATMNTPIPQLTDQNSGPSHSPGSLLFAALQGLPSTEAGSMAAYTSFFASLIFAHLLRGFEPAKKLAREIRIGGDPADPNSSLNDDDEQTSLVQILIGNLMMAQRMQGQSNNAGGDIQRSLAWARIMVGYLVVLATWLWESPSTTSEFLSEGTNLQVLIEPISQSSGVDPLVQGLCAFVLGIIYETDQDPASTIPRTTLQPILLSRVGPDQFVNRILRLREDPRFKAVGPDVLELSLQVPAGTDPTNVDVEPELWFDWPFVEFLKNNYVSIQQSILIDPGSGGGHNASQENAQHSEELIKLKTQVVEKTNDIQALERQVSELTLQLNEKPQEVNEMESLRKQNEKLIEEVRVLREETSRLSESQKENEKEQEDLLVLLEEVSSKRRRDKALMRERGMDVSEDEDDENE
ncbi:hypothetical protein Pst134EA_000231 [Puccinia striiformis f. sp. tritici]|uniref:Vesicle tethering protein Uso1/P115-like head domain-containing protein n=1 Tax=Puccinia striiformis f. sp. tritici PST-78 TaxID=1165861 RepID=A0A0L0UWP1_9BASI|nr:hypothetical protein Pst134EA_000231 [Puccinia striiformis f. sp. tritici]KAH9473153.1 hypothetical protein Pst134EA_000231 [Puccinia striiformis f. sp. tritici]KAI9599984.1 hypothetical protein KEM48_000098 [Puccinia striiformis f. sp. tritici PST-130]KNE91159.1 hypothetical protein PSTG_15414 [Puccinia striiformis f. sp. tritici PST-78]